MTSKRNDSQSQPRDDSEATVLERVQELTWALLDDTITEDEMSLLDTLLLTGDAARNRYVDCVRLHTDLMIHFNDPATASGKSGAKSQVLSFLNTGTTTLDMPTSGIIE